MTRLRIKRRCSRALRAIAIIAATLCSVPAAADQNTTTTAVSGEPGVAALRERFQKLALRPVPAGHVLNPHHPPRITWDDYEAAMELGATSEPLRVRWFDADLNETTGPLAPGRWGAWIEGTAPNGTPLRRSMTFYCRPPMFLWYGAPKSLRFEPQPGPIPEDVWREHADELDDAARELLGRELNRAEETAVLLSALGGAKALGRKPAGTETAAAIDEDYHLALKLRVTGLDARARPLPPPRKRATPAPVLRPGSAAEAGVATDTRRRLDTLCRRWAAETGEPFTVLVARRGVVVLHGAYGKTPDGRPVPLDLRADVASITKSITGILFARFLDDGRVRLDDPVSVAFPDYPTTGPQVPTFRDLFMHMSGLTGHGTHGGVTNPHFENVVLNGLDILRPGTAYNYTGTGYDLAGKAMENLSGRTARRLLHEDLFAPLGLGDIPVRSLSAGAQPTAWELGVLAQWVANRGSYGDLEFVSEETFARMLPRDYAELYPGVDVRGEPPYGLGLGAKTDRRAPATPDGPPGEPIFGPHAVGHGALSQCVFRIDMDSQVVITMIRKQGGKDFGPWITRLFTAVADSLR